MASFLTHDMHRATATEQSKPPLSDSESDYATKSSFKLPGTCTSSTNACVNATDLQIVPIAATEHSPEHATVAAGTWQVKFPKGWWNLPQEASVEIDTQYIRGEAQAEYMQCRSKKKNEWQLYRIDFNRMEQTNTTSGRVRPVRWVRAAAAQCIDTAHTTSSAEPAREGVWSLEGTSADEVKSSGSEKPKPRNKRDRSHSRSSIKSSRQDATEPACSMPRRY